MRQQVRKVEAVALVDQVASEIRRAIRLGELTPGEPFAINALSAQLGVSHIPIREALRQLETEGLVELRAGRGATVRAMSREDLRAIYRIRKLLEPRLVAWSCALLTDDELDAAEALLPVYRNHPGSEEEQESHKAFHLILLSPAASEWDLRILEYLWNANDRYLSMAIRTDPERLAGLHRAHTEFLAEVRARSQVLVEQMVHEHLSIAEKDILSRLDAAESDDETPDSALEAVEQA